jgi:hypothetical protein
MCDLESVKILVSEGGADLDAQNRDRETPLGLTQRLLSEGGSGGLQEIHDYLKGVWEEKEKRAQAAKEELVKQEEINEERERKR